MSAWDGSDRDCYRSLLAEAKDEATNPDQIVASLALTHEWPGGIFVSERISDRIIEEAGRRIYESQQARLSDRTSLAARRAWRSQDVPAAFWESYREDARAALFHRPASPGRNQ